MNSVAVTGNVSDQTRRKIEQNREELEALADSDLPAARIARVVLRLGNK